MQRGNEMTSKHRITINLDDDEYQALQHVATNMDRSLAWVGRRAICTFVAGGQCAEAHLYAKGTAEPISTGRRAR